MKARRIRVSFDVNIGVDEIHPNYAAMLVDSGLQRVAQTNPDLLSWEAVHVQEMSHEVR
jgi:hypothetical protein